MKLFGTFVIFAIVCIILANWAPIDIYPFTQLQSCGYCIQIFNFIARQCHFKSILWFTVECTGKALLPALFVPFSLSPTQIFYVHALNRIYRRSQKWDNTQNVLRVWERGRLHAANMVSRCKLANKPTILLYASSISKLLPRKEHTLAR